MPDKPSRPGLSPETVNRLTNLSTSQSSSPALYVASISRVYSKADLLADIDAILHLDDQIGEAREANIELGKQMTRYREAWTDSLATIQRIAVERDGTLERGDLYRAQLSTMVNDNARLLAANAELDRCRNAQVKAQIADTAQIEQLKWQAKNLLGELEDTRKRLPSQDAGWTVVNPIERRVLDIVTPFVADLPAGLGVLIHHQTGAMTPNGKELHITLSRSPATYGVSADEAGRSPAEVPFVVSSTVDGKSSTITTEQPLTKTQIDNMALGLGRVAEATRGFRQKWAGPACTAETMLYNPARAMPAWAQRLEGQITELTDLVNRFADIQEGDK